MCRLIHWLIGGLGLVLAAGLKDLRSVWLMSRHRGRATEPLVRLWVGPLYSQWYMINMRARGVEAKPITEITGANPFLENSRFLFREQRSLYGVFTLYYYCKASYIGATEIIMVTESHSRLIWMGSVHGGMAVWIKNSIISHILLPHHYRHWIWNQNSFNPIWLKTAGWSTYQAFATLRKISISWW